MYTRKITTDNLCFDLISSLTISVASLCIAMMYTDDKTVKFSRGENVSLEGIATSKLIKFPLHGPLELALQNLRPESIEFTIEDIQQSNIQSNDLITVLKETTDNIFSPYFVIFYENNFQLAKDKYGTNYSTWPETWRMAWAVRNALSHDGRIYFRDLNYQPITWNNVTISPENQNEEIRQYINFADMVLLIFDMEDNLN